MTLEIYDTTLREGEQSAGASFSIEDRIAICRHLDNLGVDYIEVGWPLSSDEVFKSFKECISAVKKAKIVAFGSTSMGKNIIEDRNLNSIVETGVKYACIVGKTPLEHVAKQLNITPEENLKRISESIGFLRENNIQVFYDAEHYFDGFKLDKEYAVKTLISAAEAGAERLILCDTNGGVLPDEAEKIIKETKEAIAGIGISPALGVHFHDDCGLALANTLASLQYVKQVQGTINGIGERVGNLNFSEFLPVYIKKLRKNKGINLKILKDVNEEVFRLSGMDIPESRAFVGDTAFAHKGGIHTDAAVKGISYEHENPEEFGNKRIILLNTLGGRSCVTAVANEFGYRLNKKDKDVKEKISMLFNELALLERKGYRIGAIKAEQFLLIEKYFGNLKSFFEIKEWSVNTSFVNGKEVSRFKVKYRVNSEIKEEELSINGGPVDAAYKTLVKALTKEYPEVGDIKLVDFHVSIAKSRMEESSVRTMITFRNREVFETVGVDTNILQSAIEALVKGFRYYLNRIYSNQTDLKTVKNRG